ncbi:GGDEF domain-containing protein [Pleionea sp. CnH1-48]|uniref:GGDEF domain-containing protein n=1 Tax=Pleionea sp. CnH1-48 TaxID=2954494 RepID=UPI0020985B9B|nr:GGDEF domain-containing protein [Pleionea sp. CnH1-48]MCO7226793.1 GGDEF domain-containing protein [Pleionea sp. CnH1-48]
MKPITLLLLLLSLSILANAKEQTVLADNTLYIDSFPVDLSHRWQLCNHQQPNPNPFRSECELINDTHTLKDSESNIAVLRVRFILDESLLTRIFGLYINELHSADELYLNGHFVARSGHFPPSFENASYYKRYYLLPSEWLYVNKPNELELRIYDKDVLHSLNTISAELHNAKELGIKLLLSEVMYMVIAAMLMVIATFKAYYFIRIPSSRETLSLALFCICTSLAIVLQSQLFLMSGFDLNGIFRIRIVLYAFAQISLLHFLLIIFDITITTTKRFTLTIYSIIGVSALIWPQVEHLNTFFVISQVLAIVFPAGVLSLVFVMQRARLSSTQEWLSYMLIVYLLATTAELARELLQSTGWFSWQHGALFILAALMFALVAGLSTTHRYWQFFKGSTYDHLTGTLLKPSFIRRLSEEMQRCQRGDFYLLVAVLDLDQFKMINQNYGHNIGDRSVVVVSAILTRVLRQFDLICRLSDDEFCIAATLPSNQDADNFLKRLHEEINSATLTLDSNHVLGLQTTTGAVMFDAERHKNPDILIYDAEHAVTEAKMKKRGSIQWFDIENPPLQITF